MAPGWIIFPAIFVLGYSYLFVKEDDGADAGVGVAALRWAVAIASLLAVAAVAWWLGRVLGLQH